MRTLARKLRNAEGAEIAEAALVLPVVFLFLLGIIWFGRAFNIYSTITQAAQQGAIVAARASCATCSNSFPGGATVTNTISAVMQASSLNDPIPPNTNPPTPKSCVPPFPVLTCPPTGNVNICSQALLNDPLAAGQIPQCGTIVSFQYPFKFYLPFTSLNLSQITMSAEAQSRMEN